MNIELFIYNVLACFAGFCFGAYWRKHIIKSNNEYWEQKMLEAMEDAFEKGKNDAWETAKTAYRSGRLK